MDPRDEKILNLLAEGLDPYDIAAHLCDEEAAAGEYEGCSLELEMAASEHIAHAERLLAEAGGA